MVSRTCGGREAQRSAMYRRDRTCPSESGRAKEGQSSESVSECDQSTDPSISPSRKSLRGKLVAETGTRVRFPPPPLISTERAVVNCLRVSRCHRSSYVYYDSKALVRLIRRPDWAINVTTLSIRCSDSSIFLVLLAINFLASTPRRQHTR